MYNGSPRHPIPMAARKRLLILLFLVLGAALVSVYMQVHPVGEALSGQYDIPDWDTTPITAVVNLPDADGERTTVCMTGEIPVGSEAHAEIIALLYTMEGRRNLTDFIQRRSWNTTFRDPYVTISFSRYVDAAEIKATGDDPVELRLTLTLSGDTLVCQSGGIFRMYTLADSDALHEELSALIQQWAEVYPFG